MLLAAGDSSPDARRRANGKGFDDRYSALTDTIPLLTSGAAQRHPVAQFRQDC
jgi:hypothetical protein